MLIDSFLFNDEFELAEARMRYLNDVVDYFVVVEAEVDHANNKKPMHWRERQFLQDDFGKKIVKVELCETDFQNQDEAVFGLPRRNVANIIGTSRRKLGETILERFPNADFIYSDVDEIPRREAIEISDGVVTAFEQSLYYYFVDCRCITIPFDRLPWSIGSRVSLLAELTLNDLRNNLFSLQAAYLNFATNDANSSMLSDDRPVENYWNQVNQTQFSIRPGSGWHFSYMGGIERVSRKIQSSGHTELFEDYDLDKASLKQKILSGRDILDRDIEFEFVNSTADLPSDLSSLLPRNFFAETL